MPRLRPCLVAAVLLGALVVLSAREGRAQTLTLVAPAAPGGGWDQTARAMQRALATTDPSLPVQVDNVPGAAGTIGLARFVTAERGRPEALLVTGLVMVSGIVATGSAVSLADVTPIARLTGEPEVIVVPAHSPHRTLQDLLDAFRRAPTSVSWGGGSAGGTDDLLARLLAEAIGVAPADVNYVAFSGGGEALAALLGGQVTAGVSGIGEFAQSIQAGQLRALAVTSPDRLADLEAPTLREAGVPLDLANWRAIVAPPGLSAAEVEMLRTRVQRAASSAPWREALERSGWTDLYLDGPAFRQFLLAEQARVEAVLRRLGTGRPRAAAATWTPSARTAPAAAVAIVLLLVAIRGWQIRARTQPAPEAGSGLVRVAALAGVLVAHALLQPITGFVPTATALFATGASALGSRRPGRDVLVGASVAAVIAVVFTWGLRVPVPMGWGR